MNNPQPNLLNIIIIINLEDAVHRLNGSGWFITKKPLKI